MTGSTARTLGVRPQEDIPVLRDRVSPGTGGVSVAPESPLNLPSHRRPPALGGTGRDPVWRISVADLGEKVTFRRDKPTHGLLEPACEMGLDAFQDALAELSPKWVKL